MIDYPLLAKDRELSADEALEVLEAGEFCVVSTVDADGMPYGVPLSYVMLDGALCFHTTNKMCIRDRPPGARGPPRRAPRWTPPGSAP